jgi:NAD(P)-dependent dehydrogenase (short-subunit alcohol dehydrogenase family)
MANWTTNDIPDLSGKRAIVTGATGGLGLETALVLASKGAEVIVAGRNPSKGNQAVTLIQGKHPDARVTFGHVDLADLSSVAAFADAQLAEGKPLDLLINNAGLMSVPQRQATKDGFELQLGTNFLGHFALTMPLLKLLRAAPAPRIVNLSSLTHLRGKIEFDDLQSEKNYSPWRAYAQSKLAMLLFTVELQRRIDLDLWNILAATAHPGWARTDLVANGPASSGFNFSAAMTNLLAPLFGQSAAAGAGPTLYAATSSQVAPAGYYGPSGFNEFRGSPTSARASRQAGDRQTAIRLWEIAEKLTHSTPN